MADVAHEAGVSVASVSNFLNKQPYMSEAMAAHSADGLILSPLMMTVDNIAALDGDYPLVLLGERLFGVNAPHVVIRNREGAAAATSSPERTLMVREGSLDVARYVTSVSAPLWYLTA